MGITSSFLSPPERSEGSNSTPGNCTAFFASYLRSAEDLDRLAGRELHDGLLPAGARAADRPAPLRLRPHLDDVHARDLDVEQLLDRLAHLRLVRVLVHAERVLAVLDQRVRLLGHDR